MNEGLYNAVFCYGENQIDPFEQTAVDFDRIISDMRLVAYEITSFNVVNQIMLEQMDILLKTKGKIVEQTMDMENRDAYCREKYGVSFKDIWTVSIIVVSINTGAYMAESVRGGIMSIDKGQFEAGRSLGFGYVRTMAFIIIPQAFKTVLPALANEFIVLIKETSVSGYVGLQELTKGGDIIRSRTYSAFMPLIAVAIIYLVIVMFFSWLVSLLERRLKNSER